MLSRRRAVMYRAPPALVGELAACAHRLAVQDAGLSRRKRGFDSPWAYQDFQWLSVSAGSASPLFLYDTPENAPECGLIRSANITPDGETGIGGWSRDDFIAGFTALVPPDTAEMAVAAGEANTVMPWWEYAGMTETNRGAIHDTLRRLPASRNPVVRFAPLPAEGPLPAAG